MKRLLFSDIHLHTWTYGATVTDTGYNSRLWAQAAAIQEMINDAVEQGCQYAYFCGDLFHTHGTVPTQALSVAGQMFSILRHHGIKVRAIPGNHDMYDRQGQIHALSWLPQEEIRGYWVDGDLPVWALPYTDDEDVLKRFLEDAGQGDGGMVLLHQGVAGVPLSSGFVLDERLTPDMIPDNVRAFTGHYHFHRAVTPNLTVVGNLTPLNWGDIDQEKGWVIWDDETGSLDHRIQTKSPYFISFSGEEDLDIVDGNFVRYTSPVEPGDMESIRAGLIKEGARTVEFSNVSTSEREQQAMKGGDQLTVEHLVEVFEQDIDDRRKEVGVEVREEKYESPV